MTGNPQKDRSFSYNAFWLNHCVTALRALEQQLSMESDAKRKEWLQKRKKPLMRKYKELLRENRQLLLDFLYPNKP